jgi:hypothetical protein
MVDYASEYGGIFLDLLMKKHQIEVTSDILHAVCSRFNDENMDYVSISNTGSHNDKIFKPVVAANRAEITDFVFGNYLIENYDVTPDMIARLKAISSQKVETECNVTNDNLNSKSEQKRHVIKKYIYENFRDYYYKVIMCIYGMILYDVEICLKIYEQTVNRRVIDSDFTVSKLIASVIKGVCVYDYTIFSRDNRARVNKYINMWNTMYNCTLGSAWETVVKEIKRYNGQVKFKKMRIVRKQVKRLIWTNSYVDPSFQGKMSCPIDLFFIFPNYYRPASRVFARVNFRGREVPRFFSPHTLHYFLVKKNFIVQENEIPTLLTCSEEFDSLDAEPISIEI